VTVYLVRHAQAFARHEWRQPDDLRPLSPKGERQAQGLVDLLACQPVDRVLSSPSLRCCLTVAPLAEKLALEVEVVTELLEGASASRAVTLVESVAAGSTGAVLCSHGDVIPGVLRHLTAMGLKLADPLKWAKGSAWALEHNGLAFTTAHYLPPPA